MKLHKREIAFYTILVFAVVVTLVLLVAARGIKKANEKQMIPEAKTREYKYHYMLIQNGFGDEMSKSLLAGAKRAGDELDILVEDARELRGKEASAEELLKMAIAAKVDGIIVRGNDSEKVKELINIASERYIPVATVGRDVSESKRKCFVGVDTKQAGEMYASRIGKMHKKENINVAVLTSEDEKDFTYQSIVQSVKQEEIHVYPIQKKGENTFSSDEQIRALFLKQDATPDVIVCLNELDTICAYKAAVDYNKVGKVQIIGYSSVQEVVDAIQKGIVDSSISFRADDMGEKAVKELYLYRDFKKTESYVTVEPQIIEKDNAAQYRGEEKDEN